MPQILQGCFPHSLALALAQVNSQNQAALPVALESVDYHQCNKSVKEVFMPRGDGTGPSGQGPGTGRGMGMGRGAGRGRMGGNKPGAGPSGNCVCPSCGTKVSHQVGAPCYNLSCPKCGAKMARE
jgi:hypothetical protein